MSHTQNDVAVVALVRAGLGADAIYETLWPRTEGDTTPRPLPFETFRTVCQALEVADATATPPEELPKDLEAIVDDLLVARKRIMDALAAGCDLDESSAFDNQAHVALCKNAEAVLKYQNARQERQVHRLNLRVAAEKARLELLALYDEARKN